MKTGLLSRYISSSHHWTFDTAFSVRLSYFYIRSRIGIESLVHFHALELESQKRFHKLH